MVHLLQYFIIYGIYIHTTIAAQNCSAINSYVKVTSPANLVQTLLSSQALFAPYYYYVNSTELVQLTSDDNICTGSLKTKVINKIVLIVPSNGNCSYVLKIHGAEKNGAKAVLLANIDESSHTVSPIINDYPTDQSGNKIKSTIPARMITFETATRLKTNDTIKVEFGCSNETNISSVLCLIDESGDHWWLDGDYQLQQGLTMNDHHVWIKEGYLFVLKYDYYLFLHIDPNSQGWYWTITEDSSMKDDTQIVAKCSIDLLDDPMDCPKWYTTNTYPISSSGGTYSLNENIKINNSLCASTDNYICIKSTQSQLAGLYGTYRQFNKNEPLWFREHTDCDTQPGYIQFVNLGKTGQFWLIDPFDSWVVAECTTKEDEEKNIKEYVAFHPEICTEWKTLVDGSLDSGHKIYDSTLSISVGSCGDVQCIPDFTVPDTICMARNSIMHSFLEGSYKQTGFKGNKWNTSEWIRSDSLYYDGEYIPVYVWYYGEISDKLHWWVISSTDITTAIKNNGSSVYGYCPSYTNSPTNCKSCWNFYFSGGDTDVGAWHSDCKFSMIEDECITNLGTTISYEWPNYLCVKNNASIVYDGDVDFNLLIGGYEINNTLLEKSGNPYWKKPANDYNDNATYIYYDVFYGYWQIGNKLHGDSSILFCMENSINYLPTHCQYWYDENSNYLGNGFIYSSGCTEKDILKKTVTKRGADTAIIAVLVILALIACVVAGFFYYKYYQKNKSQKAGFSAPTSGGQGIGSSGSVELGDDVDQMGLVGNTTKGGMDMSPLNTEDVDAGDTITRMDDDDGDDDDDDDDEQLIGNTTKGNEDGDDTVSPDPEIEDNMNATQPVTSIIDE